MWGMLMGLEWFAGKKYRPQFSLSTNTTTKQIPIRINVTISYCLLLSYQTEELLGGK